MTSRFNSFTVVLEKDVREDDAQTLVNAISMLKGVLAVRANVSESSVSDFVAETRVKMELKTRLFELASAL
jgi:hypothetical protein